MIWRGRETWNRRGQIYKFRNAAMWRANSVTILRNWATSYPLEIMLYKYLQLLDSTRNEFHRFKSDVNYNAGCYRGTVSTAEIIYFKTRWEDYVLGELLVCIFFSSVTFCTHFTLLTIMRNYLFRPIMVIIMFRIMLNIGRCT